jgi:hypothetical protein
MVSLLDLDRGEARRGDSGEGSAIPPDGGDDGEEDGESATEREGERRREGGERVELRCC